MITQVSYWDLILSPIYILFFYFIAAVISKKYYGNDKYLRKKLMQGFWIKILFAILYVLFIQFYYGGGDSFMYYEFGQSIHNAINDNFSNLKFLYGGYEPFYEYCTNNSFDYVHSAPGYMFGLTNQIVSRFSCIFGYFSFQNYTVTSLFFSVLSYIGIWKMLLVFYKIFPQFKRQISFSFLFLPSFLFWGSGILKESLCLFSLGLIVSGLYNIFYFKKSSFLEIVSLIIGCLLLITTKNYIFYSFILAFILLMYRRYTSNKGFFVKILIYVVAILVITTALQNVMGDLENDPTNLANVDNLIEQTKDFKESYEDLGGAFVDIGDFDPTLSGIAKKIPTAIMNVFFRPFPWEARSVVLFTGMLESLFFLILLLRGLYINKIFKFFGQIAKNPVLFSCLLFSLVLGIIVGLTTFNFGSIVRYKIPSMPFFSMVILILNSKTKLT